METVETKNKFIELRAKGYSFDKIAKELGKAKQTLIDWSKDLEEEIANLKALELEALYEEFYLLKEERIRRLGKILKSIEDELLDRDLSDVATDRLLDLLLKYRAQIEEDLLDPTFKSREEISEEEADRKILQELTTIPIKKLKTG